MLMLLPIALCLLLAVEGRRRGRPSLIVLSGMAGAAAFWIKPTGVTSALFAGVYLLAGGWLDEQNRGATLRRRFGDALLWSGGAAAISIAVVGASHTMLFTPPICRRPRPCNLA
jgi:hypothetical protein